MALVAHTVGGGDGQYASVTLWEADRDGTSSGGDTERALIRAGTYNENITLDGWTANVTVELYADTSAGADHSGIPGSGVVIAPSTGDAITINQTSHVVNIVGITIDAAGNGITQNSSTNSIITVQKCLIDSASICFFINGPGASPASSIIENSTLYGAGTDALYHAAFVDINPNLMVFRNCTIDNRLRGRSAAGQALDCVISGINCLLDNFSQTAGGATWHFQNCIAQSTFLTLTTDINNTESVTWVDGAPAAGQVGFIDKANGDYHLYNDANNLAIDYADGALSPTMGEDIDGHTYTTTGTSNINAGSDQFLQGGDPGGGAVGVIRAFAVII